MEIVDEKTTPSIRGTIDIGVNYNKDNLQLGLNYFYSKHTDVIGQDRTDPIVAIWKNLDEIDHWGGEFEGKWYFNKELLLLGSALYQENENKVGIKDVTPIANFGAKYGISYKWDRGATLGLYNTYHGVLDDKYNTNGFNPYPSDYNKMDLNCRLNTGKLIGQDKGLLNDMTALLRVDNLLDEEIWLPAWGLANGHSMPVNRGRTIYGGIEMSL